MNPSHAQTESRLLGCFLLDGGTIDRALAAGITAAHWHAPFHSEQFRLLCDLRLAGKSTDLEGIYAATASDPSRLQLVGGIPALLLHQQETSLHAGDLITAVIANYGVREAHRLFTSGAADLKAGRITADDARSLAEQVVGVCSGNVRVQRSLADITDEAIKDIEEKLSGKPPSRTLIYTGLPKFDRFATPMESHEIVIVGARTSHGKSSFMNQVVGHNLGLGRRVAVFPLETSDKSVVQQIVAQRARVNLRNLQDEPKEKQQEFQQKLKMARNMKNLMVFDQDLTLEAIEARCRLLATSFKPDLVVLDYIGLIRASGDNLRERITKVSNALIPLRKALGCCLMVGCQLNRSSEKEEREPTRTDFAESGSIEQDASRLIVLWRLPGQPLDNDWFDTKIMQLKLRDGPLAVIDARFHSPHTLFVEAHGN